MAPSNTVPFRLRDDWPLLMLPALVLSIHCFDTLVTTYGIFRDELYYIACTDHLAAGYVDHPPFSIYILSIIRQLFGDSLFVLRIVPSLAHAITVLMAGILAGQLGGRRSAQILASAVTAFAPGIMGMTGIYSMNAIDILLWPLIVSLFLRMEGKGSLKEWIVLGLLMGTGLMNKVSMGWLAVGLATGILTTPVRSMLRGRGPWIAAGVSLLIFVPFIVWNVQHDMAHLEFARNAAGTKYASQNPITFLTGFITLYNPITVPVWVAGLWLLMRERNDHRRVLGFAVAVVLLILLVNVHSKAEYFNSAAVILFAAGSVWWEQKVMVRSPKTVMAYTTVVIVTGAILLPLSIDVVPYRKLNGYMQALHIPVPNTEGHAMGALPQHFADRFGWQELTASVGGVFQELSPADRKRTAVYVRNYGEAAAIDRFGSVYGLPKAMCGHNSYWYWGKERLNDSVEVLIAVGGSVEDYSDTFGDIRRVAVHHAEYVMPYENDVPIYLCRNPRKRLRDVWHTTRHFQ